MPIKVLIIINTYNNLLINYTYPSYYQINTLFVFLAFTDYQNINMFVEFNEQMFDNILELND